MRMRVIAILSIVVLASCSEAPKESENNGTANTSAQVMTVSVVVAEGSMSHERIVSTGTIMADESVELMSEIAGRIESIDFNEGEAVRKGDLLLRLVNDDLKAEYQKAKYEKKLQEDREERQRKLLEISAVSQEAYDTELNQLNVLTSQLNLLDAQLAKTEIRAPFDGIVGLRYISQGAIVSPGTTIATLQKVKPVKIEFSVPERYGRRVAMNSMVKFAVAGIRDTLQAQVYAREPRVDPNTRTLRLRARYNNDDAQLLPGGFANVSLELAGQVEVVQIPAKALVPEIKGAKVYVVENGLVAERKVEVSGRDAEVVRLSSGVQAGDTIITSGLMQVKVGMKVNIDLSGNVNPTSANTPAE